MIVCKFDSFVLVLYLTSACTWVNFRPFYNPTGGTKHDEYSTYYNKSPRPCHSSITFVNPRTRKKDSPPHIGWRQVVRTS